MVGWKESLHSINHLKKPTKETNQQSYFFDLIVKGPILQNKLFKKRTINITKKHSSNRQRIYNLGSKVNI